MLNHPGQSQPGPAMSKFPAPSRPTIVYVTKEQAGDWLDNRIPDRQRKLSKPVVARYTEEMNAGRWKLTPEGLMLDLDGWLFDGQHRLQALRNSNLEGLDFWIFPDQTSDLFSVINVGYGRQARQLYGGPNATTVTSSVRYLGDPPGRYITTMTPAAALQAIEEWPETVTHASSAMGVYLRTRIPASPHLAVLAQAERTAHRDKILDWLNGLSYGANLNAGDPRLHLRSRFGMSAARGRANQDLNYNLIAKAWNQYVTGDWAQSLRWAASEGIISVTGSNQLPATEE